jgi:hypothetical protein
MILDGRLTRITTPRRSYPDRTARQDVIAVIRPLPVSEVCFGGSDWELPRDSRSALPPSRSVERVRRAAVALSALSQNGLTFAGSDFETHRWLQVRDLAIELLAVLGDRSQDELRLELGRATATPRPRSTFSERCSMRRSGCCSCENAPMKLDATCAVTTASVSRPVPMMKQAVIRPER